MRGGDRRGKTLFFFNLFHRSTHSQLFAEPLKEFSTPKTKMQRCSNCRPSPLFSLLPQEGTSLVCLIPCAKKSLSSLCTACRVQLQHSSGIVRSVSRTPEVMRPTACCAVPPPQDGAAGSLAEERNLILSQGGDDVSPLCWHKVCTSHTRVDLARGRNLLLYFQPRKVRSEAQS